MLLPKFMTRPISLEFWSRICLCSLDYYLGEELELIRISENLNRWFWFCLDSLRSFMFFLSFNAMWLRWPFFIKHFLTRTTLTHCIFIGIRDASSPNYRFARFVDLHTEISVNTFWRGRAEELGIFPDHKINLQFLSFFFRYPFARGRWKKSERHEMRS